MNVYLHSFVCESNPYSFRWLWSKCSDWSILMHALRALRACMFPCVCSLPLPRSSAENDKRLWRQRLRSARDSAWTVMRQDSFTAAGHAAASDTGWFEYCIRALEMSPWTLEALWSSSPGLTLLQRRITDHSTPTIVWAIFSGVCLSLCVNVMTC